MKKSTVITGLAVIMVAIAAAALHAAPATGMAKFEKQFASPSLRYGSAPFWSWNEKLEPHEMARQLDEFHKGGYGGVFMHARIGLISPYMGKDWMDGVKLTVERSKKYGMYAYLYDEDRWPSGFASGVVPKSNPEYRGKAIIMIESEKPLTQADMKPEWKVIRVFAVDKLGSRLISSEDVTPAAGADVKFKSGKILLYFIRAYGSNTEWFNGGTYIDTMNPDAVGKFISTTYDAYYKAVGKEFGKTVPSIFTDEPCFLQRSTFPNNSVPWTNRFSAAFKTKYGYAIEDNFPFLFYDSPKPKQAMQVRLHFWSLATEMFRDSFGKQIYNWCGAHNIEFTGHYMCEDNLQDQIKWIGAAMPMYEYMQQPGIDHLGRNINDVLTAKQASSAAHQFGRPLVLTELYGCAGWNLSLEQMKWIADWHYVLGVNFMNQHLAWYTSRGIRKTDYPCCISYQSPWWRYHKTFADYLTRATYTTSQGDYIADALVLHPITSAWTVYMTTNFTPTAALSEKYVNLIMTLSSNQVDYDLGDEIIISRHGKVSGKKFIVNKMSYGAVVVPTGTTLRASTVTLLKKFIANGGKVIMMDPAPQYIDMDKPLELKGAVSAADPADAVAKLVSALPHHVKLSPAADKVYLNQRKIGDSYMLLFVNTSETDGVDTSAVVPYTGRVREWNLFTGKKADYAASQAAGKTTLKLHFEPAGSILLSISPKEKYVAPAKNGAPTGAPVRTEELPGEWQIVSSDLNALTIDNVRYTREGDTDWTYSLPWYVAQESIVGNGAGKKFKVRYIFNIEGDPKTYSQLWFVLEQPDKYKMSLNDKSIEYKDKGWWRDASFKKIDIRGLAVEGRNVFEIEGTCVPPTKPGTMVYVDGGVEVQPAYVIGDFNVKRAKDGTYKIIDKTRTVKYGDLVKQGFPFFSGSIVVGKDAEINAATGEKVYIEFNGLYSITTAVKVNGKDAGLIAFHPYRLDITKFVKKGNNRIEIELTDSNRNLMGPHHQTEAEPRSVGPGSFKDSFIKAYNFVPFGITDNVSVAYYK